jgi:hypothetical protein
MPELIKNYMDRIQIGAEQSYKNLAVFPVVCIFRSIPATDSGRSRPPIPIDSGH